MNANDYNDDLDNEIIRILRNGDFTVRDLDAKLGRPYMMLEHIQRLVADELICSRPSARRDGPWGATLSSVSR